MSRNLEQGTTAIARDIALLSRVLQRVVEDPNRVQKDKEPIVMHLREAISLLMNGTRTNGAQLAPLTNGQRQQAERNGKARSLSRGPR